MRFIVSPCSLLTGCAALALTAFVAPAQAGTEKLRYSAESRFQVDAKFLGVAADDAEQVTVRTEMDLDCTRWRRRMRCFVRNPEVAWTIGADAYEGWAKQAEVELDGARVELTWDAHGGLAEVDVKSNGPTRAPHAILRETVVQRALAGFDLPVGDPTSSAPALTIDTRLVPPVRPGVEARHRLRHHIERLPDDHRSQITTTGTIAWLDAELEDEDHQLEEPENRYQGQLEAEGTWDDDEGHLLRRRWKTEIGDGWYVHTGSVRLQDDDQDAR